MRRTPVPRVGHHSSLSDARCICTGLLHVHAPGAPYSEQPVCPPLHVRTHPEIAPSPAGGPCSPNSSGAGRLRAVRNLVFSDAHERADERLTDVDSGGGSPPPVAVSCGGLRRWQVPWAWPGQPPAVLCDGSAIAVVVCAVHVDDADRAAGDTLAPHGLARHEGLAPRHGQATAQR